MNGKTICTLAIIIGIVALAAISKFVDGEWDIKPLLQLAAVLASVGGGAGFAVQKTKENQQRRKGK